MLCFDGNLLTSSYSAGFFVFCIGGDQGCLYSLSGAPARPRSGSQHRPPRPPADLLRRPPPGPQHPPPRPPLTSSTAPSAALSTHPHGAPYHPTKRPLRGPQPPPPGVPPPPHQSPPPRLPAPTPTAPHWLPPSTPSTAPSTPPPRHHTPHPPPCPAQPPRLVSRFPHRKNSGGQIKKWNQGSVAQEPLRGRPTPSPA